jgi:L-lactate dehydrogenase complex protein LldF
MVVGAHARFVTATREAVANAGLSRLLDQATDRLNERRAASVAAVPDWQGLRARARRIKEEALADLDRLLAEFERQVTARGGRVHHAATAADACRIVRDIARASGATTAVKGKSMVSEEVHLNAALAEAGVRAIESDLGEFIVQIAGETPSHIIAPALHKSRGEISRLFADKLGIPLTDDLEVLTRAARARLRAEFAAAGLGLSGVNLAVAETGTIVLLENEGNIRLSTSMPRVHVALMGLEKVIPRVADLPVFLTLLPRNATGQPMATYVSMITGPRRAGELDGPDELHIVVLDNGRSALRADPIAREALMCIRCGACLNACPVYRTIGGHAYGTVYAGPIGSIISPYLQPAASAPDLPFASSLCGACAEVCPVKIDLPGLLVHQRGRAMRGEISGERVPARGLQRIAMRAWAFAMRSPWRYRVGSRVLRVALAPISRDGWVSRLPGPAGAWTTTRDFPAPAGRTFRELWERRT